MKKTSKTKAKPKAKAVNDADLKNVSGGAVNKCAAALKYKY